MQVRDPQIECGCKVTAVKLEGAFQSVDRLIVFPELTVSLTQIAQRQRIGRIELHHGLEFGDRSAEVALAEEIERKEVMDRHRGWFALQCGLKFSDGGLEAAVLAILNRIGHEFVSLDAVLRIGQLAIADSCVSSARNCRVS